MGVSGLLGIELHALTSLSLTSAAVAFSIVDRRIPNLDAHLELFHLDPLRKLSSVSILS